MFPSLAARDRAGSRGIAETYVAEKNFAAGKQKVFLPEAKNSFASWSQMLLSKYMFPSLASTKTMLTSFQCC